MKDFKKSELCEGNDIMHKLSLFFLGFFQVIVTILGVFHFSLEVKNFWELATLLQLQNIHRLTAYYTVLCKLPFTTNNILFKHYFT